MTVTDCVTIETRVANVAITVPTLSKHEEIKTKLSVNARRLPLEAYTSCCNYESNQCYIEPM